MMLSFDYKKRVEFADTDMAGIVHFANFFRYMEMAEHALWRSLELPLFLSHDDGRQIVWPRVKAECDYQQPLRFGDEVTIRVTVEWVKNRSLHIKHEFIMPGAEHEQIATGNVVVVCAATGEGNQIEAVAIPEMVRSKLLA